MPNLLLSDLQLTLGLSPWFFIIFALAAVALAVVVYRHTLPPVDRLRRVLLWVLRGSALVLILFMIFEPVLNYLRTRREKPTVALLVDKSASVGETLERGQRAAAIRSLLKSPALRELAGRSQLRTFSFADSVVELALDSLAEMPAGGVGTNLALAWERAARAAATEHIAAMVLISDGANNSGPNPERTAAESRIPLYTIGVGDTAARADAAVADIFTNDVTYVGSKTPVDVRVRGSGLKGHSTRLRLLGAQGAVLHEETIRFADDFSETTVHATFDATLSGEFRLTAVLDSVGGESIIENNRRSVIVNVLENRARVVLLSGPPGPDFAALRQSLERDSTLEIKFSVELAAGKKLRGSAGLERGLFDQAKLVVMLNYPSNFTSAAETAVIVKAIQENNLPVLFFAGAQVSASALAAYKDLLPVQLAKSVPSAERVVLRDVSSHPAISGSSPLPADWGSLPPVSGGPGNFVLESGAQVIARLSREALGIPEQEPAVAVWDFHRRRGAAVLVWNSSQWKFQLAAKSAAADFYNELVSRLSHWLVSPAEEKRFVIRTGKKLYSGGEKVLFNAQVYGADLQPRDDAVIDLKVRAAGRTESVPLRSRGNGRFDAEFLPWGDGEYTFQAEATAGRDSLGSDRGLFAVEAFNIELLSPRARHDVLRGISERSGGQFARAEDAAALLSSIRPEPREVSRKHELPLWNQASMLWVIIGLLAAEWVVRKRSGML